MTDQQESYLPQLTDYETIPLTKEGVLLELQTAATQSWIRALANFQVLGSPVVLGGLQHQEHGPNASVRSPWSQPCSRLSLESRQIEA